MSRMPGNSQTEGRAIASLSLILAFRMLGLFMIFPIFALYTDQFTHTTPTLIGVALGIYGLTQALLQLPLSMLSDRIGRKPIITMGLLVFAIGSIIAALSHNIYLLILGRALQGAGAIGSTINAFVADLTKLEHRTKAMAILGLTIGVSFTLAMVLGPLLNNWIQLSGIFWLTALFACLGIVILHWGVPTPKHFINYQPQLFKASLKQLLQQGELVRFNIGILLLHAILTGSFVVIPILLQSRITNQWAFYLPILTVSFIIIAPIILLAERKNLVKETLITGIVAIIVAELLLYHYHDGKFHIIMAMVAFFAGFTLLEAILPSLISKLAPSDMKGSAMGIFSSFQFFGIFIGGWLAGFFNSHFGYHSVFMFCAGLAGLWLAIVLTMKQLPQLKTELLRLHGSLDERNARIFCEKLYQVPGVLEASISINDGIAYLKVDNKILNQETLKKITNDFYGNRVVH
jgi:MFS family permease